MLNEVGRKVPRQVLRAMSDGAQLAAKLATALSSRPVPDLSIVLALAPAAHHHFPRRQHHLRLQSMPRAVEISWHRSECWQ